jgi:hypothetical protein
MPIKAPGNFRPSLERLFLSRCLYLTSRFSGAIYYILHCRQAAYFEWPMVSTCCQPITDSHLYGPIFKLDFSPRNLQSLSDAIPLGCATRFNLPTVDKPGLVNDRRFQGLHAAR